MKNDAALTVGQQGLWYLSQMGDDVNAAYNLVFAFAVDGELDLNRLDHSLAALRERHEALRAVISPTDSVPRWQIASPSDAAGLPKPVRRVGTLEVVALEERARIFRWDSDEPWRVVVVTEDTPLRRTSGLVFTFHHLVFDGASATVFFGELGSIFNGAVLPPARGAGLLDVAARHEAEMLASVAGQRRIACAAAALEGLPSRVELPRKAPMAEPRGVFSAATVSFAIEAERVRRVRATASDLRVSTAAVYLAAFQIVLWRYSGQVDFALVLPVVQRNNAELEEAVGYFTNLAVIRARIAPFERADVFVHAVHDNLLDVQDDCDLPYPVVARKVEAKSGAPLDGRLMQLGFNHSRANDSVPRLGAATLRNLQILPHLAKSELKLDVNEREDGADCLLVHDADGFDTSLVERMSDHWLRTIDALTGNPGATLARLPMLSENERQQSLASSPAEPAMQNTAHALFESWAARAPHRIAASFQGESLTYGELNARANRLAHYLRTLGVGPDVLVAVALSRSTRLLVALWAILKAGGAYLPLDIDYPPRRLAHMLDDSRATTVLTESDLGGRLPSSTAQVVLVDTLDDLLRDLPTTDLTPLAGPSNLVYCIYTSGSTGRPKGALNTHVGLVNLVRWYFAERGEQRVLLASSPSFDLTQKNLLGASMAGHHLIVPSGDALDPEAMDVAMHRHRPTWVNCTPSAFRALFKTPGTLLKVVLGGEPIDRALAKSLREASVALVNGYGPTECSAVALAEEVDRVPPDGNISLGRPLPGVRVYVLDELLRHVPSGAIGQIHIAGQGVGRGYVHRARETAEHFQPDPFGPPGERMYATGDLGIRRLDGKIDFKGRRDNQVKVRGYRIELAEVEAALLAISEVGAVAVVVHQPPLGRPELAAYVVPHHRCASDPSSETLRAHAQELLPEYMVPRIWVILPALPLSPNGKIDRQALPVPDASRHDHTTAVPSVAPRNESEQLLAQIFAQVLQIEQVGIHDNFFALGGHSILASQIVARVIERTSRKLSLRSLVMAPTIAQLALELEKAPATTALLPVLARRGRMR